MLNPNMNHGFSRSKIVNSDNSNIISYTRNAQVPLVKRETRIENRKIFVFKIKNMDISFVLDQTKLSMVPMCK